MNEDKKHIIENNTISKLKISDEQKKVSELIKYGNVVVDSVAGSGKTTTIIFIGEQIPKSNILVLTYNSKLKVETRERIKSLGLKNIETHSYHSFCVKYYNRKCFTDKIIAKIVDNDTKQLNNFSYDIIIIDECQDMTPLYYKLSKKIYNDNFRCDSDKITNPCKLCILGDKNQSIYAFNGADERFITMAKQCFNWNNLPWKDTKLSISFRTTQPNSDFLNNCILGEERMKSIKPSRKKPKYIICNTFGAYERKNSKRKKLNPKLPSGNKAFDIIKDYLKDNPNSKPSDIFVLAPSIKSENSPARKLENMIKKYMNDILVYVPTSDEEKIDANIIENKLVFSTFHQSKGLERKLVIVFGFDDSYMKFFKKNSNPNLCPNELYVAATRALDQLVLLHHYENNYLPFLKKELLSYFSDFKEERKITQKDMKNNITKVDVSQLTKHLKESVVTKCLSYFKIKNEKRIGKKIDISIKTKQKTTGSFENVSEITGIAIPLYYEYLQTKNIKLLNKLSDDETVTQHSNNELSNKKTKSLKFNDYSDDDSDDDSDNDSDTSNNKKNKYSVNTLKQHILNNNLKSDEILYIANRWNTYKNGYLYKLNQIKEYNWLSEKDLKFTMKRLINLKISNKAHFEYFCEIQYKYLNTNIKYNIQGYYDCYDYKINNNQWTNDGLYEFKCVDKLKDEHYLQLAIYIFMDMTKRIEYYKNIYNTNKLFGLSNENNENIENNDTIKELINKLKNDRIDNGYYIYNILTNQKDKLIFTYNNLSNMMDYLIKEKYYSDNIISDEEFLQNIKIINNN